MGTRARHVIHRTTVIALGAALALAGSLSAGPSRASTREVGETRVFTRVPYPGQPQGIVVDGDTVWTTSAVFMEPDVEEWPIWAYDRRSGAEKTDETFTIPPPGPVLMALSGMAQDAQGRLYLVDMNGRILRTTGPAAPGVRRTTEVYATIPSHGAGHPHMPWPAGLGMSMPLDITFDAAGNAYVTDLNFPGVWRVPPGGGEADLWFLDRRLQGSPAGTVGARIGPSGRDLYVTVCSSSDGSNTGQGVIYRLPVDRSAEHFTEVHRVRPGACPKGLAFGASGKLYVALGNLFAPPPLNNQLTNQILVLDPDGTETLRFPSPEENARLEIPYDQPLFLAFDGDGSLLVANEAITTPNSPNWAILKAFVDDTAAPLAEPSLP